MGRGLRASAAFLGPPGSPRVVPEPPSEPPGAKTASHALKCGRHGFAKWGLPRFRAQKPDFAPESSIIIPNGSRPRRFGKSLLVSTPLTNVLLITEMVERLHDYCYVFTQVKTFENRKSFWGRILVLYDKCFIFAFVTHNYGRTKKHTQNCQGRVGEENCKNSSSQRQC